MDTIAVPWDQNEQEKNYYHFLTMLLKMMKKKFCRFGKNKLVNYPIGGGHQYSEPLISILTILASMEEPLVRDKAIDSLNKISLELSDEEINGFFLTLIQNLSQGNWFLKKLLLVDYINQLLLELMLLDKIY